jgi:3-oxoacyl-[acyl-carrier-protein] synthase III
MNSTLGILSAACRLPAQTRSVAELFADEGLRWSEAHGARLGIERVPVAAPGELGSTLGLEAAQATLTAAGVAAADLDVIVDCTALPQEYLVPAWSMSNKLQAELGAAKAFTIGFSGGGATNFHTALHFAACIAASDARIRNVLMVAADLAIPHNRVLAPEDPVTVLGDAASALLLGRDAASDVVMDTELHSDGELHAVCYVPGGAMAHPDRRDLFRLQLDVTAYRRAPRARTLSRLAGQLLARHGVAMEDIALHIGPNLSRAERCELAAALGAPTDRFGPDNLATHGHLHATDFVLNYRSAIERGTLRTGDHILISSHGFGFVAGVSLLRH